VSALDEIDRWPVDHAAGVVVTPKGIVAAQGDIDRPYPLASVTKMLTAYATLVAVEEGAVALDQSAGPATVRHLLAHASGMAPEERRQLAEPGRRRIYSNSGFDVLGEHVAAVTGVDISTYVTEAVFDPLSMKFTTLNGSPAKGAIGTAADLAKFAVELMGPSLVDPSTVANATRAIPGTRRSATGLRATVAQRLGVGGRTPVQQASSLDRVQQFTIDVRTLRSQRDVCVGRSHQAAGLGVPH